MGKITFDKTADTAAEVAEEVCRRFASGERGKFEINGIPFELTDVGMCSEFVRECSEAAWDCVPHGLSTSAAHPVAGPYFGGSAKQTERLLSGGGKHTANPKRGDIVCFNINSGVYGHVGIYLGNGLFAENTSSRDRGPGFVISNLSKMQGRVTGYYSILPARQTAIAPHDPPLLIGLDQEVVCEGKMIDGTMWTPTRKTVEACAKGLTWHSEQGKAYITPGPSADTEE